MTTVQNLERTCYACPSQWEGTTMENEPVYVRYRWGHLTVQIGSPGEIGAYSSPVVFQRNYGDELDGVLNEQELEELTKDLIDWVW